MVENCFILKPLENFGFGKKFRKLFSLMYSGINSSSLRNLGVIFDKAMSLEQCFSILVLTAPRPACFPCFPAPAHLIQMNGLSSAFCRA